MSKDNKKKKEPFKKVMKRWFFGVGKEFNRINWTTKKQILVNTAIILIITIFLALVFFGLDWIFLSLL